MVTIHEPEEAPHHAKKNTAKWCRGKVGREHVSELRVKGYSSAHVCRTVGPFRDIPETFWTCSHVHACANCSKVLSTLAPGECPDKPEEIRGFPGFRAAYDEYRKKPTR